MAASTRWSSIPRRRSCRTTISPQGEAKSGSVRKPARLVDVVVQSRRIEHGHAAATGAHDAGALEVGEETADALPRGAGELGEVGLVHANRHLPALRRARRLLGDQLRENPGDTAR